jgi:predicted Zn-dependent protease
MQSPRSAPRATAAIALATVAALLAPAAPVHAQGAANRGLPIVRDAEAEQLLRDYARPILRVAGLAKQNIQVVIINDRVFNAFVADSSMPAH